MRRAFEIGGSARKTYHIIWATVQRIPRGKVATYGEVAGQSGFPRLARLVGYALHSLPEGSAVPWHRVVNRHGAISFPRLSPHHREQRKLLEKEGVVFRNGRVDLRRYGWLNERK